MSAYERIPFWLVSELHCAYAEISNLYNTLFGYQRNHYQGVPPKMTQEEVDKRIAEVMRRLGFTEKEIDDECCGRPHG